MTVHRFHLRVLGVVVLLNQDASIMFLLQVGTNLALTLSLTAQIHFKTKDSQTPQLTNNIINKAQILYYHPITEIR